MENNQLNILRKKLPNGAYKIIANKTGYSIPYISKVLRGERPLTAGNSKIVREAVRIIKKNIRDLDIIINSLKSL